MLECKKEKNCVVFFSFITPCNSTGNIGSRCVTLDSTFYDKDFSCVSNPSHKLFCQKIKTEGKNLFWASSVGKR